MPFADLPRARIYYEEHGSGFPVLAIAPGGLGSQMSMWENFRDGRPQTYPNPVTHLSKEFRVVAMDQRNAGRSTGEIGPDDGWETYVRDQLALMDHLGITRFHVIGACIGGPFGLKLIELAPERIASFVMQATIGLHENAHHFKASFDTWSEAMLKAHPGVQPAWLDAMHERLYSRGFVFSVDRDFVRHCQTPLLVLRGNNAPHPYVTSEEIAELAPNARLVRDWDGPENRDNYLREVPGFLRSHTPA